MTDHEKALLNAGDALADALNVILSDTECEERAAMLIDDVAKIQAEWERVSGAVSPRL